MSFEKVGFIGLGLIGGSIAKKLKSNNPDIHIIATAGHRETITAAYEMQLIDNNDLLPISAFSDCDYIFLCAPVQKNISYLEELKNVISPSCIITDVGSTKTQIHEKATELSLDKNFIGGHPMTGSEKTGIQNADEYLLENAYYIITPTEQTKKEQLNEYIQFVNDIGSIPIVLDYRAHDYATASISHLPHIIAFSLVNLVKEIDDENETMRTIAAGGFRDITRIASSSPVMWEHICSSNKEQILRLIDLYQNEIDQIKSFIQKNAGEDMRSYFQSAKDYRDSLSLPNKKRAIIFELYLDLIDEAGGIATIATILAGKGINIKNIGIVNNREFEEGVLHIEFYTDEELKLAAKLLKDKNYTIYER